jgi:hypothetical protein
MTRVRYAYVALLVGALAACSSEDLTTLDAAAPPDDAGASRDATISGDATNDSPAEAAADVATPDVDADAPADVPTDVSADAALDGGADALDAAGGCDADFTQDPANCGRCGHDCLGGACVTSQCRPATVIASLTATPQAIAVDDTYVYWTDNAGAVNRCAVAGCTTKQTLATNQANPNGIVVDGTSVYWVTMGDLASFPAFADGGIHKANKDGGGPTTMATNEPFVIDLRLDGTTLYFTNNVLDGGAIKTCSTSGCGTGPTRLVTSAQPRGPSFDGTNVYWGDSSGKVLAADKIAGGTPQILSSGAQSTLCTATDGTNLYWAQFTNPGNVVRRAPGGGITNLATNQAYPEWVAVADGTIYWKTGATIKVADATTGANQRVLYTGTGPQFFFVSPNAVYWGDLSSISRVAR